MNESDAILLADVGGTNVRFAVLDRAGLGPVAHRAVNDYQNFADGLERISHTTECIGVANQREPLCRNNSSSIRGAPRCRQSVARISLDLNLLKAVRW